MTLEHNPDHVAEGLDTLIHDFRKPKLQALATSFLEEAQALEDDQWQLYLDSMIRDAFGDALDRLGGLVNQPRENRTDDVYRLWILARALVLRSSGRPEELIAVARVVFPRGVNIRVVEEYPAGLTVRFEGVLEDTSARAMAALLRDAKADGVRLLVTWNPSTTPFRYAVTGVAELDSPSGYGAGNYNAVSA